VYLSNLENITFREAWNALFSGNCADWFLVDEAVLVDWPTGNVTYAGNENDPPVTYPEPAEYSILLDSIVYDIDGDGAVESCVLTPGPTSGLCSFHFYANSMDPTESNPKYTGTYVFMGHYDLSFELTADGALRIKGEDPLDTGEAVYFDIALEYGKLVLQCEDKEMLFELD
jgi:hypothetical protein